MIQFNAQRDRIYAHRHEELDKVLHVVHGDWHGIRSATSACPGMRLSIPHAQDLDGDSIRHVHGLIYKFGFRKIVFQGFSNVTNFLASDIKKHFGDSIDLYAITHVNSSQFEHHFEMHMQELLIKAYSRGVFRRLGSVKPDFHSVVSEYWPRCIINYAPNFGGEVVSGGFDPAAVFLPLENTWRKNLYTNILAAIGTPGVEVAYTVNWPSELERIATLSKVRLIGYQRGVNLFATMASVNVVLAVTLAECQPMTQLEAFAVGTPSLTGPLGVEELADHEVTRLCEVSMLDNPLAISKALARLVDLRRSDPEGVHQMLRDYLSMRHAIAHQRYLEFLEL